MKALVWIGENEVEIRNMAVPIPAEDEALIKVHSAGICGTDLHILDGRHPRGKKPPIVLGHEISGQIVDIQKYKDDCVSLGDRVVVEPLINCGHCYACKKGSREICEHLNLYGVDVQGGFAEFVVINKQALHKIPDSLPMRTAALAEPAAVAVHAVRRSSYKTGDSACVIGGGPIGSMIALILHTHGCNNLVVIEPRTFRRDLLNSLGVKTLDPGTESIEKEMASAFDIVFDTAGVQPAIDTAVDICKPHGSIVILALPGKNISWNHVKIVFKEIGIIGSRVYAAFDFKRAVLMLDAHSEVFEKMIFPVYKLTDGNNAFSAAKDGTEAMRVMFDMETKC